MKYYVSTHGLRIQQFITALVLVSRMEKEMKKEGVRGGWGGVKMRGVRVEGRHNPWNNPWFQQQLFLSAFQL